MNASRARQPRKVPMIWWQDGCPTRLPLSGLFLLAPEVDFSLLRVRLQATLEDAFTESGFPAIRAKGLARGVIRQLKTPSSKVTPTFKALMILLDQKAPGILTDARLSEPGPTRHWTITDAGLRASVPDGISWITYYASIEQACSPAFQIARSGDYQGAADLIESQNVMVPVLWPDALDGFRASGDIPGAIVIHSFPILLELRLSALALMERDAAIRLGRPNDFCFDAVLPHSDEPAQPMRLCIRRLLGEAGFEPIEKLLDGIDREGLDSVTVSRWKKRPEKISDPYLKLIIERIDSEATRWELHEWYIASRQLRLISGIWKFLKDCAPQMAEAGLPISMPWGYSLAATWIKERLGFWRQHHAEALGP